MKEWFLKLFKKAKDSFFGLPKKKRIMYILVAVVYVSTIIFALNKYKEFALLLQM